MTTSPPCLQVTKRIKGSIGAEWAHGSTCSVQSQPPLYGHPVLIGLEVSVEGTTDCQVAQCRMAYCYCSGGCASVLLTYTVTRHVHHNTSRLDSGVKLNALTLMETEGLRSIPSIHLISPPPPPPPCNSGLPQS